MHTRARAFTHTVTTMCTRAHSGTRACTQDGSSPMLTVCSICTRACMQGGASSHSHRAQRLRAPKLCIQQLHAGVEKRPVKGCAHQGKTAHSAPVNPVIVDSSISGLGSGGVMRSCTKWYSALQLLQAGRRILHHTMFNFIAVPPSPCLSGPLFDGLH